LDFFDFCFPPKKILKKKKLFSKKVYPSLSKNKKIKKKYFFKRGYTFFKKSFFFFKIFLAVTKKPKPNCNNDAIMTQTFELGLGFLVFQEKNFPEKKVFSKKVYPLLKKFFIFFYFIFLGGGYTFFYFIFFSF